MKNETKRVWRVAALGLVLLGLFILIHHLVDRQGKGSWQGWFADPPAQFRPQPFWHLNGHLTTEEISRQLNDAYLADGFGGVAPLPVSPGKDWYDGTPSPGMTPEYMSTDYFARYRDILDISAGTGRQVILYDDIDFPSGTLHNRIRDEFPHLTKRELNMRERAVRSGETIAEPMPCGEEFLGVVAMNATTFERIDLTELIEENVLRWEAPEGDWKVLTFTLDRSVNGKRLINYMDTAAVATFIALSYDRYAEQFGEFFGSTITKTFFDDVGFSSARCWNPQVGRLFEERYGRSALLSYPALWYDIGPETAPIRTAFFGLRAELIGEGFPRQVAEWAERHGLSSMGHPPGNYEPTAVDMYGDPFKFYKYTHIPLLDAIHGYPFGRSGFKLISSAADAFDRPVVGAEIYGNYAADMDSLMLYRMGMECLARGVNFLVPHGMWYDCNHVKIPPLVAHYSRRLGPALPDYSSWAGRAVALLQGGRRVADIAMLYPIHSLEAWFGFDPGRPGVGKDVPPGTNYHNISDWLTGELRYDFTFVHPELLTTPLYSAHKGRLTLRTEQTRQEYRLLIIPSGRVISADALQVIRRFWEGGGKVIAAGTLPSRSAEFGRDGEVAEAIGAIFAAPSGTVNASAQGGEAIHLPEATRSSLAGAIAALLPAPDIRFAPIAEMTVPEDEAGRPLGVDRYREHAPEELGMFSCIHKSRDGREIFFFANSTNRPVDTWVELKGRHALEMWDPHTGAITPWTESETRRYKSGEVYTRIHLELEPVQSLFAVSR